MSICRCIGVVSVLLITHFSRGDLLFAQVKAKNNQVLEEKDQKKDHQDTDDMAEPVKQKLVIYTSRAEHLIKPVIDLFIKETGIQVKFQTGSAGLFIEKLKAQKKQTDADIFITVDAGNLWAAKEAGLLQQVSLPTLDQKVPRAYRDHQGYWWGISLRARTVVYNSSQVKADELSTYEDLAAPKWQGKLCLRTAKKVYNQSLVAMLIHHHGKEKTTSIIKGWVANLATKVFSSDTLLITAVSRGQCALGIVNSYYLGRLQKKGEASAVKIFWPNQKTSGVHVNVSGAGIVKHAKNLEPAKRFMNFLMTPKAQELLARLNLEYPTVAGTPLDPVVRSWGDFRASQMPLTEAGRLQSAAIKLMDYAGYR
ncbi:MAG: extracellular solute-binding protein [Proteobacteria bacterium]|nr:extracellular solute-binding protein [Pseudomonadota bacterium]